MVKTGGDRDELPVACSVMAAIGAGVGALAGRASMPAAPRGDP